MNVEMNPVVRSRILFALLFASLCSSVPVRAQESVSKPQATEPKQTLEGKSSPPTKKKHENQSACSVSKTNRSCELVIDRSNPVAPPTIQLYSGETLTVVVKKTRNYERYFLDLQTGQATVAPDVTSSIVQGLFASFAKLQEFVRGPAAHAVPVATCSDMTNVNWPAASVLVASTIPTFQGCLSLMDRDAVAAYQALEPYAIPDSLTPGGGLGPSELSQRDAQNLDAIIQKFLGPESAFSAKISTLATNRKDKPEDQAALDQLANLQKLADGVATDLLGYDQRVQDLTTFDNGSTDCTNPTGHKCVTISAIQDDPTIYQQTVTRTATYALNVLNLVANTREAIPAASNKKCVATVIVNYADRPNKFPGWPFTALRLEASAGVFFSALPNRSFVVAPIYTGTVVTDNKVQEKIVLPTPIPFAAANYRLTDDLPGRWKSNVYWTAAIGINPNTTTADFATGFSYAWRALMLSALCHFGHDTHLTQGFTNKQDLGPSFSGSLPTTTFWRGAIAFGVSVRVPSLTGR